MFYLDECHLKKKLHNSFNLHQSTKCVDLQSSLTSIFTLIVIFNLHTETDIIVFYEDGLPSKKKTIFIFSTGLHRMCSLADLTWVLYNFSFNSWYLIMSFHHANHWLPWQFGFHRMFQGSLFDPYQTFIKSYHGYYKTYFKKNIFRNVIV